MHEIRTVIRLITWTERGIDYESDPRHVQILLREFNLSESGSGVSAPGVNERPDAVEIPDEGLPVEDRTAYRSSCMRVAYLAQDRPDLGIVTRELAKGIQVPMVRHQAQLKRVVRFLKQRPRLVQQFVNQQSAMRLTGWSDADHAGCLRTRKSTTGSLIMIGSHTICHWCRGQAVIALSSGEAEYYSFVTLMSELCGLNALAWDWNLNYKTANIDATAAIGILSRRGLGRVKHIDTVLSWVQERVDAMKKNEDPQKTLI